MTHFCGSVLSRGHPTYCIKRWKPCLWAQNMNIKISSFYPFSGCSYTFGGRTGESKNDHGPVDEHHAIVLLLERENNNSRREGKPLYGVDLKRSRNTLIRHKFKAAFPLRHRLVHPPVWRVHRKRGGGGFSMVSLAAWQGGWMSDKT